MISSLFDVNYTSKRLLQNENKSTYIESAYGVGHLRQSSEEVTSLNSLQYGELWELFVEEDSDIIVTDKVVVEDEDYEVKGVKEDIFGSINFKKILLVKKKM